MDHEVSRNQIPLIYQGTIEGPRYWDTFRKWRPKGNFTFEESSNLYPNLNVFELSVVVQVLNTSSSRGTRDLPCRTKYKPISPSPGPTSGPHKYHSVRTLSREGVEYETHEPRKSKEKREGQYVWSESKSTIWGWAKGRHRVILVEIRWKGHLHPRTLPEK